jgi:hypothetical protein
MRNILLRAICLDTIAILVQIALVLANNRFGWQLSLPVLVLPSIVYVAALVLVGLNVRGIRSKLLGR